MIKNKFESVICNLCSSNEKELILVEDGFKLVRCRNCGLIFVDNRLVKEESIKLYNQDYFSEEKKRLSNIRERHILNKIKKLKGISNKGSLLDIGCAEGGFLQLIRENTNLEPFGIDISEYAATQAKASGLNVKCCDLLEASFDEEYFDVITVRHVLEHLYKPLEELKEMRRILKRDGILIIEVPNSKYVLFKANFIFKLFKKQIHIFETKQHLYHFDRKALSRLLALAGFIKKTFFLGFPDKSSESKILTLIRILYSYLSLGIYNIMGVTIGSVLSLYASKQANICINIGRVHNIRAGVNRYASNLSEYLARTSHNNYIYYNYNIPAVGLKKTPLGLVIRIVRLFNILYKEQLYIGFILKRNKIDLIHSTAYVAPILNRCLSVVSIHDMAYMLYPDKFVSFYRRYLKFWLPLCIRVADRVITDSYCSKKDIVRLLGIPEKKIDVVYLGKGEDFRPITDRLLIDNFRKSRGLERDFILYIGTLEPRKNITGLIKAYHLFRDMHPEFDHALVIGGEKGWMYSDIFILVDTLGLRDDVIFMGYIEDKDLPLLYNAAKLFVYPSLYEGFGLPVLEAMACGIPVITSNTSSLLEIVADAGIMIDPLDTSALAKAMYEVLTNLDLKNRLVDKGLLRAKDFTWEKTAEKTLEVYEKVLKRNGEKIAYWV